MSTLQVFSDGKIEANAVCVSSAIAACERSGKWQIAINMLLADVPKNLVVWNAALRACAVGAKWQLALHVFGHILSESLQADVISYSSLSLACAEAEQWQKALHILQLMDSADLQRNAVSDGILISSYSSASRWQDAVSVVFQDRFADLVCCTSAIGACASAEQWQMALHLLRQSQQLQLEEGDRKNI